jgi:hypothetical protein
VNLTMNDWPFDQPENCAVFTTTQVLKEGYDIVHVSHDAEDHGWQFHYGGEKTMADAMIVNLSEIVAHDPTVLEVADLPPGWKASREKKGSPWLRVQDEEIAEDEG